MALTFEIAGAQIDGARDYQEDAFLITHLTDKSGKPCVLAIVADGMGGHAAGNVASNMAVQAFNKHVSTNYPSDVIHEVLNGAVLKANGSIAGTVKETPALEGMGCTMISTLLEGNKIWWASVGDSHLYLIRNRALTKINADHSYGGFLDAMAKAGTPVDAEPGLARNMLMSAITGAEVSEIDCPSSPLQLQHGDKILVCSDGMNTLSDGKIIQYCDWSESPKECADALMNAVDEAEMPRQDNTTVVVIHVIDKALAKAEAKPEPEEDDDDEDITDTSGKGVAKKPDLDKTADIVQEPAPAPQAPTPRPAPKPVEAYAPAGAAGEKSKTGMIIGIAAAVIIAAGIGGFFMMGKDKSAVTETPEPEAVTTTETEAVEEPAETVAETPSEPEEAAEEAPTTAPAVTETKPEPAKEAAPPAEPAAKEPPKTAPAADAGQKEFQDALKSGGPGPQMVWLAGGTYEMGSSSASNSDERPKHGVKLKKFAVSKNEITFSEYDKFANATGRKLPDNLYMDRATSPVIFVSWDDAYNYTKWLSEETGHKYRLPSEAEWEYAASGGQKTPFWWGFNEEAGKAHCYTCDSEFDPRKPAKISSFKPNQFGLNDTAGNVAEWTHECWHENYNGAPSDGNVWEGGDCTQRIARGGSFISPQSSIRTAKRDKFKSDSGYDHVGIRVVREE